MSSKISHGTGFLTCQFVEEVALLQVELGLQCGKDDVERILGVIGGQAGVIKDVVIRMEDVRIAGVGGQFVDNLLELDVSDLDLWGVSEPFRL